MVFIRYVVCRNVIHHHQRVQIPGHSHVCGLPNQQFVLLVVLVLHKPVLSEDVVANDNAPHLGAVERNVHTGGGVGDVRKQCLWVLHRVGEKLQFQNVLGDVDSVACDNLTSELRREHVAPDQSLVAPDVVELRHHAVPGGLGQPDHVELREHVLHHVRGVEPVPEEHRLQHRLAVRALSQPVPADVGADHGIGVRADGPRVVPAGAHQVRRVEHRVKHHTLLKHRVLHRGRVRRHHRP
mmetsp:Transcript_37231/g.69939  ORF Transcript_37231/g.69939 Transcript_37231/m.69939 type:complete len:239 (+) Transcript_37231:2387-3103(+)